MMRWHLKELIGKYESKTGARLTYRRIEKETGLSKSLLSHIATNKATRADLKTIEIILGYFEGLLGAELSTGDLLTYSRE